MKMLPWFAPGLIVAVSVLVVALRAAGIVHPTYQAFAHVWIGFVSGLAWLSRQHAKEDNQEWTDVYALETLVIGMTMIELLFFTLGRLHIL